MLQFLMPASVALPRIWLVIWDQWWVANMSVPSTGQDLPFWWTRIYACLQRKSLNLHFKRSFALIDYRYRSGTTSSSSAKVQSYSSSYSSSSRNGARPVTEYSTDSMYKSQATGPSGIPHTSYAHTTSGYSSENPYKNKVSSYSYNI